MADTTHIAPSGRRRHLGLALLLIGFGAQIPLGVSVAVAYDSPLWAWHRTRMADALWGTKDVPADAMPIVEQLCAMLGATMACWAFAMVLVVNVALRRGERWAFVCVAGSAVLWFALDTALSAAHGVTVNVAFNIAAAVMMGVPLALVWSDPPE